MNVYFRRRTTVFIVRVWSEYLQQEPPQWRGEVACAGSDQRFTFSSAADMVDYLQAAARASVPGVPPEVTEAIDEDS